MKLLRVRAMARKESLHILRDPRSLLMGLAIPMILILLFGYALTLDVDNVPLAVWDRSKTPESREFISRFTGSRYFSLKLQTRDYAEVERAIDRGDALAALIVPRNFAGHMATGRGDTAQFIVDGSDSNTATLAMGYAETAALTYSQEIVLRQMQRQGGRILNQPLDVRPRVWFNPDLESKNYIIPSLIAVIMMVVAALLTSLTVAREWERGTMEQLISTPVKPAEMILGKLIPYFAIGMIDLALAVLMGEFLFAVPLRGSFFLLFAVAAVFLAGALLLGILISIQAKNQLLANQMAMVVTFLPAFLLSGFVYPIGNMPHVIQAITHLIPARYFISLLKGIYLKGVGLEVMMLDAALLTLFAFVMAFLANAKFKKKLE